MKYKKILIILLLVLILSGFSFLGSKYYLEKQVEEYLKSQNFYSEALKEVKANRVYYVINAGQENVSEYQITEVSDEETVFSLLEKLSQKENFEIETTQYDFGIFVESIRGYESGRDNKYWQYWVNDKLGEVAADKKKVEKGDKIEWRFQVPPEFF